MNATTPMAEVGLWPLIGMLRNQRWVDLTHTFSPETPHHPNFQPAEFKKLFDHDDMINGHRAGFVSHEYRFVGQWGTHVDPPVHFHAGLRHQDEIPVEEMLLPLVVLDISQPVALDPDYCVTPSDLASWERRWGRVPEGSFVALRSDWSKRWPDQARMMNRDADGICHYPGWSLPVLKTLFEERAIRACGHETMDTDPGVAASRYDGTLENYVLGRNCWQIEMLTNLDRVPEAGGVIVVTWPKAKKGSGFPARAFAICALD
jgi:kynurenine formamidase